MFIFFCAEVEALPVIRQQGMAPPAPGTLHASLEGALDGCGGAVLVADAGRITIGERGGEHLPPDVFVNLDPYLTPTATAAAGGYVVRAGAAEPEVLLIFRRGVWDLPKGKQDDGEALDVCALREVREEVGIRRLALVEPLGTTVHGYAEKSRYHVKTTHWYLMETPETDFTPQAEEDIEQVGWVPWSRARVLVGYDTLRQHMDEVAGRVHQAVDEQR